MRTLRTFVIVFALSMLAVTCPESIPTPTPVPPSASITIANSSIYWSIPTTNTDGSSLVDLGGFKVYAGTTSGTYTTIYKINDPSVNFVNLNIFLSLPGTYYVSLSSYDLQNLEGPQSSEISFTVQQ